MSTMKWLQWSKLVHLVRIVNNLSPESQTLESCKRPYMIVLVYDVISYKLSHKLGWKYKALTTHNNKPGYSTSSLATSPEASLNGIVWQKP